MPRTAQPREGSRTTRSPARKPELSSVTTPTTSCPITKGGEVIGEKYGEFSEESVPRSEPQIPERSGLTRTHSGAGSFGAGASSGCSGGKRPRSGEFFPLRPARLKGERGTGLP